MRVLVTGASGVFGRSVSRALVRNGVDVVGFARRPVPVDGVASVAGDIRDLGAVRRAATGCDRVVHLAWAFSPLKSAADTEDVNLGGTRNVLRAMDMVGADHLVFASSITAYGAWPDNPPLLDEDAPLRPDPKVLYAAHKAQAERIITTACVPAVITRSVVVVGRTLDNYEFRFLASPILGAPSGPAPRWQLAHVDDIGRFHAEATIGDRTGVVNVGPPDRGLTLDEMAAVLHKPLVRVPMGVLRPAVAAAWKRDLVELDPDTLEAFQYMPVVDTTRLRAEWGFHPTYSSREALQDTVRVLSRTWYLGTTRVAKPWRLAEPEHRFRPPDRAEVPQLVDPAPPGQRGSLDSLVDPAWPIWSAANVSEAFPGAMTPLSLSVALDCLGCAGGSFVDLLGLRGETAHAQRRYPIASFGHRVYTNVSVVLAMAAGMPGADPDAIEEQFLGARSSVRRPAATGDTPGPLRAVARVAPRIAGLGAELRRVERDADAAPRCAADVSGIETAALESLLDRLHDQLVDAWIVSTPTNMVAAGFQSALARLVSAGDLGAIRDGTGALVSTRAVAGVAHLADLLRGDPVLLDRLRAVPASATVAELGSLAPGLASAFRLLLDDVGHRGPGETELANEMYADRPELLLAAALRAAQAPAHRTVPAHTMPALARPVAAAMHRWLRRRERARDAVVRLTHGVRVVVRELGVRAAASGALADPTDIFYLTFDEVFAPAVTAHLVPSRRAERDRLRHLAMPTSFELRWEPLADVVGGRHLLEALGVSHGVYEGPARVIDEDGVASVEPGDVVVAHVTDVGWSSAFALAGAVVTDVGGLLSHAAIVARELGIPCVVATERATQVVRTGQKLRVDGTAGTVEVLG